MESRGGLVERSREPAALAWARLLARALDATFILLAASGVWAAIGFYWSVGINLGFLSIESMDRFVAQPSQQTILDTAIFFALFWLIEPFWIGLAATTPGKWIMGLRVVRPSGEKLGYWSALARSVLVTALGSAFGLAIVGVIAPILQFALVAGGRRATWDAMLNTEVQHTMRSPLIWIAAAAIVVMAQAALHRDGWTIGPAG